MSLNNESKSSLDTFMEDLVRMNGEAMAALEEVPYQPIVYAVPKEWVESWKTLLENAVQFQPTLYSQISTLATQKDLRDVESEVKAELKVVKRELAEKLTDLKEQVAFFKKTTVVKSDCHHDRFEYSKTDCYISCPFSNLLSAGLAILLHFF